MGYEIAFQRHGYISLFFFLLCTVQLAVFVSSQESSQISTWSEVEQSAGIFLEKSDDVYTDDNGAPIPSYTASRTCGRDGPIVLEDITLIQQLSRFDRERQPERVVHAKGSVAMGYFIVTNDITNYSKAALFSKVGLKTRVTCRFSVVNANLGGPDTRRDPRGFAIKFYTREGILDLPGYNLPVFGVRDPILFVPFVHVNQRSPKTGRLDPNAVWDFVTKNHQVLPFLLRVFSDMGTPDGYRYMHGYGPHTYVLVNANNDAVYCKFNFESDQGIRNLTSADATRLAGENPDYAMQDLYEAIEKGDFPIWTLYIQIMTFEQAALCDFSVLDITKVWPLDKYPQIPVGKLVLNKNFQNFFHQNEQIAFSPANLVPGIQASRDRVLQARLFSYKDTQRHRIGANFMQLPGNAPLKPAYISNINRDGPMCFFNQGSDLNYYPNSFGYEHPDITADFINLAARGEVARYDNSQDDNYSQAVQFYQDLPEGDKIALAKNIAEVLKFSKKIFQERAMKMFGMVSTRLPRDISKYLEEEEKKKAQEG